MVTRSVIAIATEIESSLFMAGSVVVKYINIVIVSAIVSIGMLQYYLSLMRCEYNLRLIGIAAAIRMCILQLTWYGRIPGMCCHSIQSSLCIWSLISCCSLCITEYKGSLSCHILYITSEMIACGSLCTWHEWPVVP